MAKKSLKDKVEGYLIKKLAKRSAPRTVDHTIVVTFSDGRGNVCCATAKITEWLTLGLEMTAKDFQPHNLVDLFMGTEKSSYRFVPGRYPPEKLLDCLKWWWEERRLRKLNMREVTWDEVEEAVANRRRIEL